jgi:hypothetical protein
LCEREEEEETEEGREVEKGKRHPFEGPNNITDILSSPFPLKRRHLKSTLLLFPRRQAHDTVSFPSNRKQPYMQKVKKRLVVAGRQKKKQSTVKTECQAHAMGLL